MIIVPGSIHSLITFISILAVWSSVGTGKPCLTPLSHSPNVHCLYT
jgi:hypothetical protein